MALDYRLGDELLRMAVELNRLAEKHKVLDPLLDTSYTVQLTYPKHTDAISVEVVIIYLSGGGLESAYVINDRVSFKILQDRFADIVFESEMMSESEEDVKITEGSKKEFLGRIRNFCESVLPDSPGA